MPRITWRTATRPPHLPHRTNTELNIGVLRRYVPSISAILSITANAVIYTFDTSTQSWDKSGVEGTLFVCSQDPNPATGEPRFCAFVLNRRGLENLILDLATIRECEVTDTLLILALDDGEEAEENPMAKALGIWMHADTAETRDVNMKLIHSLWGQVREARKQVQSLHEYNGGFDMSQPERQESVGPALQAIGKQLTIDELFASQAGGGGYGR
ncbi:unnamed protein product [Parascedosporium putredinis]|uniref:PH domain-like protein n=1 Tax=Parascedosporium putredinis TaxID=1442378 RepID=A0A9P1GZK2_9PEZI|nr:unnamed protein product [Parascedosporium putredinis]CAI7991177.1 unnamed protein product [Parascedosporium putredinis]